MKDHIETIKGLLAKASDQGASAHERAGAKRMADKLMRKHALRESDLVTSSPLATDFSDIGDVMGSIWS